MLGEIVVELLSSREGSVREEFGDAVRLGRLVSMFTL
jgi:hypothetical protein